MLTEARLQAEHSNQEKTVFLRQHEPQKSARQWMRSLVSVVLQGRTPRAETPAIYSAIHPLQRRLAAAPHQRHSRHVKNRGGGVLELRPEPTDLREVCDFVHTLFSEPATKKNLKLECHVAENFPHALLLDRIRLRQILVNLVGNAVKFTDKGGIEGARSPGRNSRRDQQPGHLDHRDSGHRRGVFLRTNCRPFSNPSSRPARILRKKEKQGTGLGLLHRQAPHGNHGRHRDRGQRSGTRLGVSSAVSQRANLHPAGRR